MEAIVKCADNNHKVTSWVFDICFSCYENEVKIKIKSQINLRKMFFVDNKIKIFCPKRKHSWRD